MHQPAKDIDVSEGTPTRDNQRYETTEKADNRDTVLPFKVFTFGSEEEFLGTFGSLERAKAEWDAVRDEFLERWNLWGMPSAWWMFEPDVPADLRRGPHAILTEDDADEWTRIEMARRRYRR